MVRLIVPPRALAPPPKIVQHDPQLLRSAVKERSKVRHEVTRPTVVRREPGIPPFDLSPELRLALGSRRRRSSTFTPCLSLGLGYPLGSSFG